MSDPIAGMILTDGDRDIAVRTVYGEARGEPFEGQCAVAFVIRNRATWQPPAWWGHSVAEVCRKPYQFSCHNAGDPNCTVVQALSADNLIYLALLNGVVNPVMAGAILDPTEGATHYHAVGLTPEWIKGRQPTITIGRHVFYRLGPDA